MSTSEELRAAQVAWNIGAEGLVDSAVSGHISTEVQNIPRLFRHLRSVAVDFFRAPIRLANVGSYSHLYCPFIWRVIKLYKAGLTEAEQKTIPEIPENWLYYGNIGDSRSNYRNVAQVRDPSFYGTGNQNQQNFWDLQVVGALTNNDFIQALKDYIIPPHPLLQAGLEELSQASQINLNMAAQIQASLQSAAEEETKRRAQSASLPPPQITVQQVRNGLGSNSEILTNSDIRNAIQNSRGILTRAIEGARSHAIGLRQSMVQSQANTSVNQGTVQLLQSMLPGKTEQEIKNALRSASGNPDLAFSMLSSNSGGKRNKRRQTKRKSRKQKRKSTYRRRR